MYKRFFQTLLVLVVSAYLGACASFHNEEVAAVDELPDVSSYQNKPTVYIDLKLFHGDPASGKGTEVPQARDMVLPAVEEMLKSKGIFSEYTFDQFKQDEMDYKLTLHFYNHGNAGAAAVSGFLCGFTFGVIPAAATDNYTLKAALTEGGSEIAALENKDSMTTWMGLWFIPMMGHSPKSTAQALLVNQVKAVLEEMIENKQLKYSLFEELGNRTFL